MLFDVTNADNLKDFSSFYETYLEPVQCALRSWLRVPQQDVDDLAQSFFLKVFEKDLLSQRDQVAQFRKWLFVSLRHHVFDHYRKHRRSKEKHQLDFDSRTPDASLVPGWRGNADDPDSLYALSVLNMTLQKMRFHCETSGKPEIWGIFDRWLRARIEDEGRSETADELNALFPDKDRAFLWNRLTSGKRIFKRIIREVIPPSLSDAIDPEERYLEWLEILQQSRAAEENRLGLVFRVDAIAPPGEDELHSINLAVRTEQIVPRAASKAPPPDAMPDDELRILLNFRLSTPLAYYVEGLDSAIRPKQRKEVPLDPKPAPLCLATLLEASRDKSIDRPALYRMLKKSAKWNHHKGEDGTPPDISKVIYNLAIVLAMIESGERITDLKDADLVKNFKWVLTREWLDPRLKPVFERGLKQLGAGQSA
jgi:DNA-directed RNA polymerase specialized sigma24 family protein